jgi:hypothetical protein
MKKLIAIILVWLIMVCPSAVFADGSVTATCANIMQGMTRTISFAWTGDVSSGGVPTKATSDISCPGNTTAATFTEGYYLCGLETSTTSAHRPTDNYDIYLNDALDNDLMGGAGENRDQNGTEYAVPVILSGSTTGMGCRYVIGPLVFTLSGNSAASATGTATFFFSKP